MISGDACARETGGRDRWWRSKRTLLALLLALFIAVDVLIYLAAPRESALFRIERIVRHDPALRHAARYFKTIEPEGFALDERYLLDRLALEDERFAGIAAGAYEGNPFGRLLNPSVTGERVALTRIDLQDLPSGEPRYLVNPPYGGYFEHPWDDEILRALYCDRLGYDDRDFAYLRMVEDGIGGYGDTHILFGVMLTLERGCVTAEKAASEKAAVAGRILEAARRDGVWSDLYAERIVFLQWAGYSDMIRKEWIDRIVENQHEDGGWGDVGNAGSDPHATALAALAIARYAR